MAETAEQPEGAEQPEDTAELQLQVLEERAAALQAQGEDLAAIGQLDQALSLKMELYGLSSDEVLARWRNTVRHTA